MVTCGGWGFNSQHGFVGKDQAGSLHRLSLSTGSALSLLRDVGLLCSGPVLTITECSRKIPRPMRILKQERSRKLPHPMRETNISPFHRFVYLLPTRVPCFATSTSFVLVPFYSQVARCLKFPPNKKITECSRKVTRPMSICPSTVLCYLLEFHF